MTSPPDAVPEATVVLASRSDVGQVRSANEDSCDIFERGDGARLLVVADGMGGHRGGATASSTALATIAETFTEALRSGSQPPAGEMLQHAIQGANARVHEMAKQDPELEGMGTTVVAFLLGAGFRGTVAHVGDSRAYRLRAGELEPITTDHSVVAEMQRRGLLTEEEAAIHPRRNEILRSVGVGAEVEVEVSEVEVQPGDSFVLCSDGLSGMVSDPEIAAIVQSEPPDTAVESLIRLANERGGPDNISVQIVKIPANAIVEGDPEATADVEISAFGIEQIENKRRQRQRIRLLALVSSLVATGFAIYFVLDWLNGDDPSSASSTPTSTAQPTREPGASPSAEPARDKARPSPFAADAVPPRTDTTPDTPESPSPLDPESVAGASEKQAASSSTGESSEESIVEEDSKASVGASDEADLGGEPPAPAAGRLQGEEAAQDRFEIDRPAPRRGIRRPGAGPAL